MKRVFISYSRNDWPFARRMFRRLAPQFQVTMDVEMVQPGDTWSQAIREGINNADWVVVVVSPAAMASNQVQNEIAIAHSLGKKIIPVLLEDAQSHPVLEKFQHADARYSPDRAVQAVRATLEQKPQPMARPMRLGAPAKKKNWGVLPVFGIEFPAPVALRLVYMVAVLTMIGNFCTMFVLAYRLEGVLLFLSFFPLIPLRLLFANLMLTRRLSLDAAAVGVVAAYLFHSLSIASLGWKIEAPGWHAFLAFNIAMDAVVLIGLLAFPSIRHWAPRASSFPNTWRALLSRYAKP